MTHLNTNHHLPVRTGASPMEDAIVQQVEWYMGRVNLEKDGFLKQKMDDDLWVSLDVILSFPKMIRMGVTDKRRVATLLNARSTVVEVDEKTARIRPAWARRSTLVIHNVPVATRREQVAALFHIPSPTADPNSTVPPSMTHPAGLVSIQLYTDTVWVAMFDSPSGAEAALPLVMHKTINGQEVIAEVHVENALPPARSDLQQARSQVYQPTPNVHHDPANSNHPSYPQMPPIMSAPMMNGQMITSVPVPVPMPVMHPGQYPYNHAAATYMAPHGYAAPGVPVPRPYMGAPRGVPHGYMLDYTQHVSFDQAAAAMPPSHPLPVSQPSDQASAAVMAGTSMPANAATNSSQVPNGFHPAPTTPNGTGGASNGQAEGNKSTDIVREPSAPQIPLDQAGIVASSVAQQPYSAGMHIPALQEMAAVSMRDPDLRGAPRSGMEAPYAPVIVDAPQQGYSRGRGSYSGGGRDRSHPKSFHDGGSRQGMRSVGGGGEGGRSGSHRKSRKGNRNSTRHGHGHDRHAEGGRNRDGRGEGSGSDSGNREDRRNFKEDKTRQEPNLASMNFPPLPGSESTPRAQNGASKKGGAAVREALSSEAAALVKTSSSGTGQSVAPKATEGASVSPGSPVSSDVACVVAEGRREVVDGTQPKRASCSDAEVERSMSASTSAVVDVAVDAADESGEGEGSSEKKATEQRRQSQSTWCLSYAAILRSKKPSGRGVSLSVRANSDGAVGGVDSAETAGATGGGGCSNGPVKEKGGKKKKKNGGQRNGSGKEASAGEKQASASGWAGPLDRANSKCSSGSGNGYGEDVNIVGAGREVEAKAKSNADNTRAHSVWANKPKSLFEAGPVGRPVTPQQQVVKAQKVTSPVSSHEEEKDHASEGGKTAAAANGGGEKGVQGDGGVEGKVESGVVENGSLVKKMSSSSEADREREVHEGKSDGNGLKEKSVVGEQGGHAGAKGAWAAGGPRSWPKARSSVKGAKNSAWSES